MCQTVKVMDYLESAGVIPRSVCSRILYVGFRRTESEIFFSDLNVVDRNIEYQKIVIERCWIFFTVERKTLSNH